MVQPTTTQRAAGSVIDGFGESRTPFGSWSRSTLVSFRQSALPAGDGSRWGVSRAGTSARPVSRRLLTVVPRLVVAVAFALLLAAIGLFAFRTLYDDRIYPAVVVGDVNVGGLSAAAAGQRLEARAAELESGTIAFSYGGQTWTPTLSELGATVNLDDSIAEAEALGRTDDAAARLAFTGEILRADQVVPLQTELDGRVLEA
ncbi:MAG: hypothetical protein H0T72_13935, partial [Chloroflexia bacterium]|nr:hypothetical protein [Chloroflexia bacterium]